MQLPLRIVRLGDRKVNRVEKTRDISSGGVCFLSPTDIEVGDRIEYLITLSGSNPPVRIRCLGKVLRSNMPPIPANGNGNGNGNGASSKEFEVAITMERYQFVRADELDAVGATA